jgi:hemolysin activation/secretion protein
MRLGSLAIAFALWCSAAAAQPITPPGDRRLSGAPTLSVKAYRFEGNTVIPDEELARVTAPWVRANVTTEDLFEVRDAVTRAYIRLGYVNSGATIPDQSVADNVVLVRITEGRLTDVQVSGSRWFRRGYFMNRLVRTEEPLNVFTLESRLQRLQSTNPGRRLDATLRPGQGAGRSELTVVVEDPLPVAASFAFSNHQSPSIGAHRSEALVGYGSLTGHGDTAAVMFAKTSGLEDLWLSYTIPLTAGDTTAQVQYRNGDSIVIEEPFNAVDIESRARSLTFSLSHPIRRRGSIEWIVGASLGVRETETWLLGEPFTFSEGAVNGRTKVAVLRATQSWTARSRVHALAMRSQFSFGLDALGALSSGTPIQLPSGGTRQPPGTQFFAWLGQFQWARRIERLAGTETVMRIDSQLSAQPLLSMEQFAIGGHASVRGYRENQMVRDSGVVASIEAKYPLFVDAAGRPRLRVGPFVDFGSGWNRDRPTPHPRSLSSAGAAVYLNLMRNRVLVEGAWAYGFRDAGTTGDLQDRGVHFSVSVAPW